MNIQDRAEYDTLFEQLCAAMGAVPTDARRNGYWKGLAQMSIIQFGRVVEYCLSEQGPSKMPNAPGMWIIWRSIQAQSRRGPAGMPEEPRAPDQSFGLRLVNQMFMAYLHQRRVVDRFAGDIRMAERRRVCLELADWIDGSKAEDMLPTLEECKAAFAGSMGRLKDQPEARLDSAEVF